MKRRIISFSAALLLSLSGITVSAAPVSETETAKPDISDIGLSAAFDGYTAYLSEFEAFKNANAPIDLGVPAQTDDSFVFKVTVPENAWYMPVLTYGTIAGNGNDVELSLRVDGKSPYEQAENFLVYRVWKNNTDEFSANSDGDEFSPEQEEIFVSSTAKLYDSEGFVTKPLCLALSKGEHSITISLEEEPAKIEKLVLAVPETLPTYKEYAAKYKNSRNYTGKEIVLEGEKATAKSQKSFVPLADRNSAEVSPADPFNKRINYIGGTNWNRLGGSIGWSFEAPSDGWYKLGFHYRQNYLQEGISYRRLSIDGEIPFGEAEAIAFPYKSGWQYFTLADENGKEMPIYLSKGEHTVTLTVTLGELAEYASELKDITDILGTLYRKIVKITGESPDANRDYDLFAAIPELNDELPDVAERLEKMAVLSEEISGAKGGSNAQIMRKAAVTINQMLKVKFEAHTKLSAFYDNYSSLCSWLYEMQNMALDIDTVLLTQPGKDFQKGNIGFFDKTVFSVKRLLASYADDYERDKTDRESLVLWLNWGRDQITLLENLVSNDFTPKTGIDVDIKITATTLVQAGLAGKGPDFQLNVARTDPLNYAMRGLLYDLTEFSDYREIVKRFSKTAGVPYEYKGGVYGLPSTETFNMLFIRTDIFEELGLEIPKTWDEFINAAKVITLNNMNCGMTTDGFMFMTQMGVAPYNEDRTATNLTSAGAVEAYTFMTDFFTKYKFPKTYSFFNRFRTGLMPMAIASYAENATLRAAAPEINGKWRMVEIPGFKNEDDSISNAVNGTGTANVILDWSDKKDKAWEFLKWWTSDDIQYRFSTNIESILGASGRYESANLNAVYRLGWDKATLKALQNQFDKVQNLPEVPGSYYVSRSVQQVFWNVVNNGQNVEDMLEKWIPEADDEIRRKTREYASAK